jgi:hypothetical protein
MVLLDCISQGYSFLNDLTSWLQFYFLKNEKLRIVALYDL